MNSTQQFIIAILAVLIPILIPAIVSLIFTAQKQKLGVTKEKLEQYKEIIKNFELTAQSLYKEWNGKDRYNWVLDRTSEKIKLPKEDLQILIESALAELKNSFMSEWEKIGE